MLRWIINIVFIFMIACQTPPLTSTPTVTPSVTPTPEKTLTPSPTASVEPELVRIQLAWEKRPHGIPPLLSLSTSGGSLQAAACDNCHESKGGVMGVNIAWFNSKTQKYEPVQDSNVLCRKCHTDILDFNHQAASNLYVHQNFECINCHDPHSTTANCSNSTCHTNILTTNDWPPSTPVGRHPDIGNPFCGGASCHPAATEAASGPRSVHGFSHASVACVACHDASGLPVNRDPADGIWKIWQKNIQDGTASTVPYSPHEIQLAVDCKRCHFTNNPWNLPIVIGNEFGN
jgi:hypothetical protein